MDERVVDQWARARRVSLRTGCFCNPGAGESAFGLASDQTARLLEEHALLTVDDYIRLTGMQSGGAIRLSLGLVSNVADVERFLEPLCSSVTPSSTTELSHPGTAVDPCRPRLRQPAGGMARRGNGTGPPLEGERAYRPVRAGSRLGRDGAKAPLTAPSIAYWSWQASRSVDALSALGRLWWKLLVSGATLAALTFVAMASPGPKRSTWATTPTGWWSSPSRRASPSPTRVSSSVSGPCCSAAGCATSGLHPPDRPRDGHAVVDEVERGAARHRDGRT